MNKIKPYDLIFVKGNSTISKIIKWFTKSEYSHVGIILDDKHICEINYNYTFRIRHFEYKEKDYDIYRCKKNINIKDKELMFKYIRKNLNQKYDFREIVRIIFPFLNIKDNSKRVICSELVYDCFKNANIYLSNKEINSPQDLIDGNEIVKVK